MAGQGFGGECACGGLDFERIGLARPKGSAYVTDLVACTACGAVFLSPTGAEHTPSRKPGELGTGGPNLREVYPDDPHDKLVQEAKEAAKDYAKPGRHTPPRYRR